MAAPNTRNWKAFENRQPPVDDKAVPFYVVGEVETTNGSIQPKLNSAVAQGFNPTILILELTLEKTGDVGTEDVAYRDARYDAKIELGQYKQVSIQFDGNLVDTIDVKLVV